MSDSMEEMERIAKAHPGVTKVIRVDEHVRLLARIEELEAALRRLDSEGRLDCVVAGETTNDGTPAPLCPEIIGNPAHMCAGCACPRPAALGDDHE